MSTIEEWENSLISAQLVQQGLLPKKRHFERLFKDHLVLYRPKIMLSGDFYWIGRKHDLRYVVVGDCTGHGISASLTSVLALNLLEYIIMNKGLKRPDRILQELNKRYSESFNPTDIENFDHPWVDIAVVAIDDKHERLYFASANRRLLHVSTDKSPELIKAKGLPIGNSTEGSDMYFELKTCDFKSGDRIFLGSDGFQDQFGGSRNKKFGSAQLHELLHSTSSLGMSQQQEKLVQILEEWKMDQEQTDDICLLGIQL
jgi:serine phosphatase RsbU (regulator of sigma subunit)